jgi:hypothetical protein
MAGMDIVSNVSMWPNVTIFARADGQPHSVDIEDSDRRFCDRVQWHVRSPTDLSIDRRIEQRFREVAELVWRRYICDFRNIALNDRLDVGTVPVLAPPLATALDSVNMRIFPVPDVSPGRGYRPIGNGSTSNWESVAGYLGLTWRPFETNRRPIGSGQAVSVSDPTTFGITFGTRF